MPKSSSTNHGSMPNLYRWGFKTTGGNIKFFGPYDSITDAAAAFQRVYGYWPSTDNKVIKQIYTVAYTEEEWLR